MAGHHVLDSTLEIDHCVLTAGINYLKARRIGRIETAEGDVEKMQLYFEGISMNPIILQKFLQIKTHMGFVYGIMDHSF